MPRLDLLRKVPPGRYVRVSVGPVTMVVLHTHNTGFVLFDLFNNKPMFPMVIEYCPAQFPLKGATATVKHYGPTQTLQACVSFLNAPSTVLNTKKFCLS